MKKIQRIKSDIFWLCVDLLSFTNKRIGKLYEGMIGKQYIREIENFNIIDAKNILHIGCGAYPITAIILSNQINGQITAIDNNIFAVKLAKKVIKKENLTKKINIKNGDGLKFPLDEFDLVIVSGCAYPQEKILDHIFKSVNPQTRIVFREIDGDKVLLSNFIKKYDDISIQNKIICHPFPTSKWNSFCIKKNN
jgi:precorrin-6B methylase 2